MTTTETSRRLSLAVVFLISRRCNLECTYCNVDASPRLKASLDPRRFEAWVRALSELGDLDLGIQLHGGEPLLLDPSVELLSSIARNALVPSPSSSLGSLAIVTNGILLNADRAQSLVDAGLRVAVSVDGPQQVHDRYRVTRSGRGSHRQAMRGLAALRSVDPSPAVIAIVSEASDVELVVQFFISERLSRVKINPIRPEGRGATMRGNGVETGMAAMADAYFEAAVMIAAHNRRCPEQPIYEENIANLAARVIAGTSRPSCVASWTLLVDDQGRLWSHPGGWGVEHMALTMPEPLSVDGLANALGVDQKDRTEGLMSRQRATFRPCAGCPDPTWCDGFRPVTGGPAVSPDCVWRERLMHRLETWWQESPLDAIAVVPFATAGTRPIPADVPLHNIAQSSPSWLREPAEPAVSALLASIRFGPNGRAYFANYADRVTEISGLDPFSHGNTFLQLAALAGRFAGQSDCLGLAQSLARLARLGVEPLVRRAAADRAAVSTITRRQVAVTGYRCSR